MHGKADRHAHRRWQRDADERPFQALRFPRERERGRAAGEVEQREEQHTQRGRSRPAVRL